MIKGILSVALTILLAGAHGQVTSPKDITGKISGKLVDSATNFPLQSATVTLYISGTISPVDQATSDTSGNFKFLKVSFGNYTAVIDLVGYRTANIKNIIVDYKKQVVDLKLVYLSRQATTLQSVTVNAQEKLIENKIDKLVFNAEKDITSQTGVATDILKKIPQISVDVDGNVELAGSTNIRFLINGKPSTIFGSNIVDVLQSIPANQVKSIEVITNPGAKYDAQGTGGVINIILKHNTIQGVNGNVSLTTGTIVQNGSVNLNARKGKFGLNAFMNGNARLSTTTPTSFQRLSTDTVAKTYVKLNQDGSSDFTRYGFQTGIAFDWTITEKSGISAGLNYSRFGNHAKGSINQSEEEHKTDGSIFSKINSINNTGNAFTQYSFDPSLNYKHSFKNKEQKLEIGMDGSFAHNLKTADNDQYLQPQDSLIYGTRNNNPAKENEYELMVDYIQPLHKDVNLGIGGKFSGYDISSTANALVWNNYVADYLYDAALSNNLNYHQKVYAAYAELSFPIGKLTDAKIGGRYERTQVNSFYANAQQTIDKGYNTLIPSIFLMRKIGERQAIKLNYTIRINRPGYADLNPFINTSDPKNVTTGNPDLKPEVWDRYEASYTNDFVKNGSFMISLFYRQSNGDIQPFIVYYPTIQVGDTVYTNVAVTTRKNIGIEKNMGTSLYLDLHINEKLNLRSNITYFYRYTINQVDPGYNSTGNIYRFNVNASYQITSNFATEIFGSYNSRHHEAQGNFPSFTSYSLAVRKLFWNKKGSVALTANNIFSKYVDQRTDLYGPNFLSVSLRRIPYQSIGINFTWKFGKLNIKNERPEDNNPDPNAY
ncbi:TonB-dependent receptor [Danxiaibacter flavus]|uniref:TonB-dependent receptor n=1 Tax=Danxiaibacter flavus TaxID=3049108 RepID=A0ABV3ZJ28_9BACT|nr:TonB-dependent receptor [Chitinophagaceae bacterium DXS]